MKYTDKKDRQRQVLKTVINECNEHKGFCIGISAKKRKGGCALGCWVVYILLIQRYNEIGMTINYLCTKFQASMWTLPELMCDVF